METCTTHEGMSLPCPLSHDDAVLDDVDAVLTSLQKETPVSTTEDRPRQFEDVINQWTDTVLAENRQFKELETGLLIMRLGTLAQRLIYEAYNLGMRDTVKGGRHNP